MKTKHPTLPLHIIKVNKHFYKDTKTGRMIHNSILGKYCLRTQENTELKHEQILSRRWDLNRD